MLNTNNFFDCDRKVSQILKVLKMYTPCARVCVCVCNCHRTTGPIRIDIWPYRAVLEKTELEYTSTWKRHFEVFVCKLGSLFCYIWNFEAVIATIKWFSFALNVLSFYFFGPTIRSDLYSQQSMSNFWITFFTILQ